MNHIFLVKDTAGSYLVHHGKPGQKWGERHGPPYPLSRQSESERKELKPGSKVLQGKEITNRRTLKKKSLEKAAKFRDKKISKLEKKRDRLRDYNVDERKAINKEIQKYKKMSLEEIDEKRKNAGKEFIQNLLSNSTKGQQWGVRNGPPYGIKENNGEEFDKWSKEVSSKTLSKQDTKFNGLAFKDSQDFQKQLKDRNLSNDDMKEYSNNKDAILKSLTGRGEKDPELAKEYKKYMKENGKLLDGAVGAMIRTETFAEKKALEMLDKKKDTKFNDVIDRAADKVTNGINKIVDTASKTAKDIKSGKGNEVLDKAADKVTNGVNKAVDKTGEVAKDLIDSVKNLKNTKSGGKEEILNDMAAKGFKESGNSDRFGKEYSLKVKTDSGRKAEIHMYEDELDSFDKTVDYKKLANNILPKAQKMVIDEFSKGTYRTMLDNMGISQNEIKKAVKSLDNEDLFFFYGPKGGMGVDIDVGGLLGGHSVTIDFDPKTMTLDKYVQMNG